MTRAEALAVLRRTLGEFHGERVRQHPTDAPGVSATVMVARLTPGALTDAMNALAVLEREETS